MFVAPPTAAPLVVGTLAGGVGEVLGVESGDGVTDVPPTDSDAPTAVSPGVAAGDAAAATVVVVAVVVVGAVDAVEGAVMEIALALSEAGGVPGGVTMSAAELAGEVPVAATALGAELAGCVPVCCVAVAATVAAVGVEVAEDVVVLGLARKKLLEPRPLPVYPPGPVPDGGPVVLESGPACAVDDPPALAVCA